MRHGQGVLVALVALLTAAPGAFAEELAIPGSGNPEFVLAQIARAFNRQQTAHRVTVPPSTGTAGALRDVGEGKATMGRVGRPLKDEERRGGLSYVPLGLDAVVFVGGAGVSARSLTRTQAVEVYTGKIVDWRELGARPGPIRALGREVTDASRQAVAREIKAFENIVFSDNVKIVHLDPQMIAMLDRYPTSLGFLNRSALYASTTRVVPLALDSIEPTPENLESGRYPMRLEFGLIYRAAAVTEAATSFLRFVGSPAGVRILRDHGVVPAPPGR